MTGLQPGLRKSHLFITILILSLPAITNATLYEVDTEYSYVEVYGWGGYAGSLTVSGYFETEIEGDQLTFIRRDVTFMGENNSVVPRDLIFPDYPATFLDPIRFEGRKSHSCTGMPDFFYVGHVVDDYIGNDTVSRIVFDGTSHFPICGNDVDDFVYRIVGRQVQPRDIPQLQFPGMLVFIVLIATFGFLFLGRYRCKEGTLFLSVQIPVSQSQHRSVTPESTGDVSLEILTPDTLF
jgi:hypothetical protein